MDAAKYVGGLVNKIFTFLKGGPDGDNKIDTTTTPSGVSRQDARHGKGKEEDTPTELKQGEKQQQQEIGQVEEPVAEMASGGQVPGSGNRDTVPAMLTPGEFVMSKGAVSKWGAGTLASMNAAAGAKNTGSFGYNEGGKVMNLPGLGGGGGGTNSLTEQAKVRTLGDTMKEVNRSFSLVGEGGKNFRTPEDKSGGVSESVGDAILDFKFLSQPSQPDIRPPSAGRGVTLMQADGAAKNAKAKAIKSPGSDIPDFSADTMVSPYKIKTLGITV